MRSFILIWFGAAWMALFILSAQPYSRKVDLSSCAWIVMHTRDVTYGRDKVTIQNPGIVECVER